MHRKHLAMKLALQTMREKMAEDIKEWRARGVSETDIVDLMLDSLKESRLGSNPDALALLLCMAIVEMSNE